MAQSEVRLEGFSRFDFDLDALKKVLRTEGQAVAKLSRRFVSRAAVSQAGEFSGKRSGHLKQTIKARLSRPGYYVVITHKMDDEVRYPFVLASGSSKRGIAPRKDHMLEAMKQRRTASTAALRSALHKTISAN